MNTSAIEDVTEGQIFRVLGRPKIGEKRKEEGKEVKAEYKPVQPQISVTELSTSLQEMVASMAQISKNIAGLSRFIKWYALVQSSILVGILIIIIYFKLF